MTIRAIGAKQFAALDKDLMSTTGAFSLDQLMELAGLAVSQALYKIHPPSSGPRVLVACGPGNNGGDGLVAARHLWHYGYKPTIYYPKPSRNELLERLSRQLADLEIPFVHDCSLARSDVVVDAIFGASFQGEVREPFRDAIRVLRDTGLPVLAVDAPSGWDIESGPPTEHNACARGYQPLALISLTAPKPLAKFFEGRHFVGGRFLTRRIADKYGLDMPHYPGIDQIVEVAVDDIKF